MIPIATLSPRAVPSTSAIALILFARYDPAGDGRPRPLRRAQAALKLMSSLLNAGNLDGRGVREAARLSRTIPVAEIVYRDCRQVETELLKWLDSSQLKRRPARRRRIAPAGRGEA